MADDATDEKMPPNTLRFGNQVLQISDPRTVQPLGADVTTEARDLNGLVALSFGAIIFDGSGPPTIQVCARLRLSLAAATDLRNMLDSVLSGVATPKAAAH